MSFSYLFSVWRISTKLTTSYWIYNMRFSRYIAQMKWCCALNACIHKHRHYFICIACLHATEKASLSRCNVHHLRVVLIHATLVLLIEVQWRWRDSNSWPPACKAGALPTELHPHVGFNFIWNCSFGFLTSGLKWTRTTDLTLIRRAL